jgi:S1-C subfamily serine protease
MVCLVSLLSCLVCVQLDAQDGDFLNIQRRITEIVSSQIDGVVRVKASAEELNAAGEKIVSLRVGTGFFISRDGHILTNASVAMNAIRVWVELNGVQYAADHLGSDPETNISLLKLMVLPDQFSYFPVSAHHEKPLPGSLVLAISCALEFEPSPSLGMVTGHESSFSQRMFPVTYLRVNIPAHPGEGGSPVVDLNGRLIGMMVASLPEVGSSYLLPARAMVSVRDDLLFSGKVAYGWIGADLKEQVSRRDGRQVFVEKVLSGGAGADSGLRVGDRLIRMEDVVIRRVDDVRTTSFFQRVGNYVEVEVEREGKIMILPVKMVERSVSALPDTIVQPEPAAPLGGPRADRQIAQ